MNELLYIFYFIALSNAFPTETILINVTQNSESTPSRSSATGLSLKRQYPKPRIVSNVYRSNPGFMSPMNPMENLLLYLLLAAGRDFAEEEYEMQKEHDRKRSPDVFSDAIGDITMAAGNLVNGTKNAFSKIEDTFGRGPRETTFESEQHPHPIAQEGTCMCFNRIFRARSTHHFEPVIRARISSGTSEHKPKFLGSLAETKKTTQIIGYKNHTTSDDSFTQQHVIDESLLRNTENTTKGSSAATVRVVRVADLIGEDTRTSSATSGMKIVPNEDMIWELQQAAQLGNDDGTSKRNTIDTGGPPPWLESIRTAEKSTSIKQKVTAPNQVAARKPNDTDKIDDDGYYFLFYSGGTENRTTAKNFEREPHNFEDKPNRDRFDITKDIPAFLRDIRHLEHKKTMRKLQESNDLTTDQEEKMVTFSPVNISAESVSGVRRIEIQENVNSEDRRRVQRQRRPLQEESKKDEKHNEEAEGKGDEEKPQNKEEEKTEKKKKETEKKYKEKKEKQKKGDPRDNEEKNSSTIADSSAENTTEDIGSEEDDDSPDEETIASNKKTTSTYLYSVTIPTAACLLLLILGLCILAKPSGNCCDKFLRNPTVPPQADHHTRLQEDQLNSGSKTSQGKSQSKIANRPRRVSLQEPPPALPAKQHTLKDSVVAFTRIDRKRNRNSFSSDTGGVEEVDDQIKENWKEQNEETLKVERKDAMNTEVQSVALIEKEKVWDEEGEGEEEEEEKEGGKVEKERRAVPSGDTSYEIMSIQ